MRLAPLYRLLPAASPLEQSLAVKFLEGLLLRIAAGLVGKQHLDLRVELVDVLLLLRTLRPGVLGIHHNAVAAVFGRENLAAAGGLPLDLANLSHDFRLVLEGGLVAGLLELLVSGPVGPMQIFVLFT